MQASAADTTVKTEFGVNVAGYLNAESGVGEAARGYVRGLKRAGIPVALNNVDVAVTSRKSDYHLGEFAQNNPYSINLICVNADQMPAFVDKFGEGYLKDRYNVGVWWWELADFPQAYWESFRWFDEIWVGSTFVQSSLSKCSPVPVVRIPPALELTKEAMVGRAELGLPEGEFLFLFMFDFLSSFERKNPLAVARAFCQAFSPDQPARLVLKCINSDKAPEKLALLKEIIGDSHVTLIDHYLSALENASLISCTDCYVSLHRSEGLGLPLAEAMLMHKPVIATGWSGNADFTTASNSYLIPYKLSVNAKDDGPYKQGEMWAEPDEKLAIEAMREVFNNRDAAALKAAQAAVDIASHFSAQTVSAAITARLAAIRAFHPGAIFSGADSPFSIYIGRVDATTTGNDIARRKCRFQRLLSEIAFAKIRHAYCRKGWLFEQHLCPAPQEAVSTLRCVSGENRSYRRKRAPARGSHRCSAASD